MTDYDIQEKLENHFLTLNTFSNIPFLTDSNVNLNHNESFEVPADRRFFSLSFIPDTPQDVGIGNNEQERYTGILQIDICTPIEVGLDESKNKYSWIKKLFKKGSEIDVVTINNVYKATTVTEQNYYRVVVRIEWTADITN